MVLTRNGWLFMAILTLCGCGEQNIALLDDLSSLYTNYFKIWISAASKPRGSTIAKWVVLH